MTKERELLNRALHVLETHCGEGLELKKEIRAYLSTPSDDAEEPVEFKFIPTGKELLRYHPDEDCIETKVEFANYPAGSKFYPPKPAEPEAKPVLYIKEQELLYIQVLKQEGLAQEWKSNLGFVKEAGDVGLYLHPPKPAEPEAEPVAWIKRQYAGTGNVLTSIFYCPEPGAIPLYTKPAEPEAETIETLKAENFKLASGQCTEGGPWGDKGGTPYCKYAARKPMTNEEIIQGVTVDTSDDFHAGYWAGIRYAEKHYDITDADV
jgi:hypothetical protein